MFAAFILIFFVIAYRVLTGVWGGGSDWLPNFAPLTALVLCGAALLPVRRAAWIPLVALLVSDLILNAYFGFSSFSIWMLAQYVAYAAIFAVGLAVRRAGKARSLLTMLLATIGAGLAFYLFTNSISWITEPGYAKNFAGWLQAVTVGLPGFPPAWLFYRNALVSDLIFVTLFHLCVLGLPRKAEALTTAPVVVTGATR